MRWLPAHRRIGLAAVAGLALLAAMYADPARDIVQQDDLPRPRAEPVASPEAGPRAAPPAPVSDPDVARAQQRIHPADRSEPIKDAFAPRSWARPQPELPPAPIAPPAAVRAEPAAAPALPYTYLGQLSEQGRTVVFLARDEAPVVGKVGDVLDGAYRIERISDAAVEFTYLPLRQRQLLAVSPLQ